MTGAPLQNDTHAQWRAMNRWTAVCVAALIVTACGGKDLTRERAAELLREHEAFKMPVGGMGVFTSPGTEASVDESTFDLGVKLQLWNRTPDNRGLKRNQLLPLGQRHFRAISAYSYYVQSAEPTTRSLVEVTGIAGAPQESSRLIQFRWGLQGPAWAVAADGKTSWSGQASAQLFDDGWRIGNVEFEGQHFPRQLTVDLSKLGVTVAPEVDRVAANEANAMGLLRSVGSSQVAYSSNNGGAFTLPGCLVTPAQCGWPPQTTPFIDRSLMMKAEREGEGYRFSFIPGRPKEGSVDKHGLDGFVYAAVPLEFGRTGRKGLAIDGTGLICVTDDGTIPPTDGGRLAKHCTPLR